MIGQPSCEHTLIDPVITTNSANGQVNYVGCNEVSYCFSYASPSLVEGDSGDVVFTFVLTDIAGNPVPIDLVNPGIFVQITPDTFIGQVNELPNNTLTQYCFSFTVDPSFLPDSTKYTQAIVTAEHDSCTSVVELEFPNTFPSNPRVVIVDERLSVVAVGTSTFGTGNMYTPALSQQYGQQVQIQERLIIDLPSYTFAQGSEIMMGPDATIVIEDGSTLSVVQGASVLACSEMWARIRVEDGGTLYIDGATGINDILIRDAMQAVQVEEGGTLYVDGAIFRNNHIGIHKAWNTGEADVVFVTNSTFEVDAEGLLPPMTGATNAQGIFINHQTTPVLLTGNTYLNLQLGVNAQNSNVVSTGETFTDIPGAGIYMGSDGLNGLTQSGGTFDNVRVAIEGRNINIVSSENQMDNVSHGYRLYNGKGRSFDIKDNTINADNFGVLMFNWNAFGTSSIADNEINIAGPTSPDAAGIRMAGMPHFTGEVVSGNAISIQGAKKGIDLQDCVRIFAIDNEIIKQDAGQFWDGIGVQGGVFVFPYCNNIRGGNIGGTQRGISISQATNVRPSCNTIDSTLTGIRYDGANLRADVRANSFNSHNNGLEVGTTGILGPQPFRGNRWVGSLIGDGLVHFGGIDLAELSQFTVNTNEGSSFGTSAAPANFIADDDSQSNFNCSGGQYGCTSPPKPTELDDFDESDCAIAIALDTMAAASYPAAERWTAKRQLYRSLLEVADSISYLDECLEDFYNTADTTTVGQFEQLRKDMLSLFQPHDSTRQTFDDNYTEWNGLSSELITVMAGLRDTTTSSQDSTVLAAQQDSLLLEVASVSHVQDSLDQLFKADWTAGASALLSVNTAITATHLWEHNQRNYNRVWLQMVADDQAAPDSNQLDALLYIAYQCPFAGGEAVYQARALLGEGYAYDDSTLCAPVLPLVKHQELAELDFEVFPNPAKSFFTVELKQRAAAAGQAIVTDLLGRTVDVQHIAEGTEQFYFIVDHAPAGMYLLTVSVGGKKASRTISITK